MEAALIVSIAAVTISLGSAIVAGRALHYTRQNTEINKKTFERKTTPNIRGVIGPSHEQFGIFYSWGRQHHVSEHEMEWDVAVVVHNDSDRPVSVEKVYCNASPPVSGRATWSSGIEAHGGPPLPHEISTGDARWTVPIETVAGLLHTDRPPPHRDEVSDISWQLELSNDETVHIGPVRLFFPQLPSD